MCVCICKDTRVPLFSEVFYRACVGNHWSAFGSLDSLYLVGLYLITAEHRNLRQSRQPSISIC